MPQQKIALDLATSPDWQDGEATITADTPVIHLRLFLPPGGAEVQKIQFENANGKTVKSWDFSK